MKEELFIRRSIRECMSSALGLIVTNFARAVRGLWRPAALAAVVCAVSMPLLLRAELHRMTDEMTIADLLGVGAFLALSVVAQAYLYAMTFRLVNGQDRKFCLSRSARVFVTILLQAVIYFGLYAITTNISYFGHINGVLGSTATLVVFFTGWALDTILVFVFFSPMVYAMTKYMMEPAVTMRQTWKNYKRGFHCGGFLVGLVLLCIILSGVVYVVAAMPHAVAMTISRVAYLGVRDGDASGLPESFPLLCSATAFCASFVMSALTVWLTLAEYYAYASIEAKYGRRDAEKEEAAA